MASFCKQCSKDLFGDDFGDFAGIAKPGQHLEDTCEGCGRTVMNHEGLCVNDDCLEKHGLDLEYGYRSEKITITAIGGKKRTVTIKVPVKK